jgi:GTP-binding protein
MPQPLKDTRFLTSAASVKQLGACHAEVAFVGRSNVGKSSLLNALCFQRGLAKVSKTPGRTRLINVFLSGADRWIVDLPGYGFATGPAKEREAWQEMIEGYLTGRPSLRMVFVLVDAEVGPTRLDHQMLDWLRATELPYRIVATKADRVKASRQLAQRRDVAADLGLQPGDIAWVSAGKGDGIPGLRQEVEALLSTR